MAKKRANGEGSIRKRKDGRWEGRYTAGHDPATGKTIYKNVLGKTQGEVKEKLKKAIADSQQLDVTRATTYTVRTWIKLWYEVYAEPRLREKTKDYYRLLWNRQRSHGVLRLGLAHHQLAFDTVHLLCHGDRPGLDIQVSPEEGEKFATPQACGQLQVVRCQQSTLFCFHYLNYIDNHIIPELGNIKLDSPWHPHPAE